MGYNLRYKRGIGAAEQNVLNPSPEIKEIARLKKWEKKNG